MTYGNSASPKVISNFINGGYILSPNHNNSRGSTRNQNDSTQKSIQSQNHSRAQNSKKLEELQKNLRKVYKSESTKVKNKKVNLKRLLKTHELNFSSPSKGTNKLSVSDRHTRGCSSGNSQVGVNYSNVNNTSSSNNNTVLCILITLLVSFKKVDISKQF